MFTTATRANIFNPIRQIQVSDGHHASTRSQKWDVTTLFHSPHETRILRELFGKLTLAPQKPA